MFAAKKTVTEIYYNVTSIKLPGGRNYPTSISDKVFTV